MEIRIFVDEKQVIMFAWPKRINSDPAFFTATKCFSSLATSPAAAGTPAQEAEKTG